MRKSFLTLSITATASLLLTAAAQAQATRTWVSGVGDDVNPCSRTAPCKTFAGAISKTAAGGEISTLDPGGYGAVTITKSISLTNDKAGEAGILASGANAIVINGPGVVVNVRGLVIDGAPPTTPGLNGIKFMQGSALHVQDCVIKNFASPAVGSGNGIIFSPNTPAELYVTDCVISDNVNAGITVEPVAGGAAKVVITRVNAENNAAGIRADTSIGPSAPGGVVMMVVDSVSAGNTNHGIAAVTGGAGSPPATILVDRSSAVNNGQNGFRAVGAAAVVRIGNSDSTGNGQGTAVVSGGQILSYGNNHIDGNTSDGSNPPTTPQK